MNLANRITLFRIFSVFIFTILMSINNLLIHYIALLVFITASISDLCDGMIARKIGKVTDFGKIIDPLADKFLISAALVILVQEKAIPAWMAIVIICREFAVMGLRILAGTKQVIIASDKLGKYKTTAQLTAIIVILVFLLFKKTIIYNNGKSLEDILLKGGKLGESVYYFFNSTPYYFMLIAVILTLLSGVHYFIKNKEIFINELKN